MRYVIVILLLSQTLFSQAAGSSSQQKCGCSPDASLLYQRVVRAMWDRDEGEHPYVSANGFIRIAIHPAWDSEYFFDVRLNRTGAPSITAYTLPKDTKTVTTLIENVLKEKPCATAESIAQIIPIRRRPVPVTKEIQLVLDEFFAIRIAPKKSPDEIRLDTTEYEVEFRGDDIILFNSDNYNTVMVKWVQSFATAAKAGDKDN